MVDVSICLHTDKTSHQVTCTENQGMKPGMLEEHAKMELHKVAAPKKRSEKDIKVTVNRASKEQIKEEKIKRKFGEKRQGG
ncbi:hypothetical protein M9458_002866, partial [Cirrhinus mrigala]